MIRRCAIRRCAAWLIASALVFSALGIGVTQDSSPKSNSSSPKKIDDDGKLWVSPEKYKELEERYQKLLDQVSALEKKLKDPNRVSRCKLTGQLDGDVAVLKAELNFDTSAPQSLVFLGLKNGLLVDQGDLDDAPPQLETTEDGSYQVRVDKVGRHRLTLTLRVPVVAKKAAGGLGNERGFELGLPGAAVTSLSLKLPPAFKDVRWNDTAMSRTGGDIPLGPVGIKSLSVNWKEPSAAASVLSAEANLKIKIEEQHVEISGDLVLEDAKNTTNKEWHLLLPPLAKCIPAAGSSAFTVIEPDGKSNLTIIRLSEPSEKVTVAMQASIPRTQPRLPIGPVLVQETPLRGVMLVQSASGAMRGQRLVVHRFGEIFQRDPPKATGGPENVGKFEFWNVTFSGKGLSPAKSSLELEWKTEKGQVEATAEHDVKLRQDQGQWLIDVETRFAVRSATNSGVDTLEAQTPSPLSAGLLWLGVQPGAGFPATLTWPAIRRGVPISVTASDDVAGIDIAAADAQQRVRLKLNRPIGQEKISVLMQTRLAAPTDSPRLMLDLPKLVGVIDRGAKVTLWTPAGHEFHVASAEPIHEKIQQSFDQMPASIDVAWRGSRRDRPARAVVALTIRGKTMQVHQTLFLPKPAWTSGPVNTGQIALALPSPDFKFKELSVPKNSQDRTTAWVKLPPETKGEFEIQLDYDVKLPEKPGDDFVAPLVWPADATSREAKLRFWTEPGTMPVLAGMGDVWAERPIERIGEASWPALVVAGAGPTLPLSLRLEHVAGHRLAVMRADRSLIRVHVDDDGSQLYRCRYLVSKFAGSSLTVELPLPWDQAQASVRIDGKEITGLRGVDDPLRNHSRVVPLAPHLYPQPVLFEIDYRIPAAQIEGRRFWLTPLAPPVIVGDAGSDAAVGAAEYGLTRWQIALGPHQMPLVLGSASVDSRLQFSDWLLSPTPSVTSAELDAWIGDPAAGDDEPISLAWWRDSVQPQRVYQFPQQFWLVFCSAVVLLLGLLALLTPAPRYVLLLIVLAVGLGLVALGLFHDSLLPPLFFGCEPGLLVLLAVGLFHVIAQERRRRSLTFAPTFARVPQGSTLIRGQQPRDPSTVDAPPGMPGSVPAAKQGT